MLKNEIYVIVLNSDEYSRRFSFSGRCCAQDRRYISALDQPRSARGTTHDGDFPPSASEEAENRARG